jgi:MoaA/NifB/PqqE/SkfB family radical SAM enzyme
MFEFLVRKLKEKNIFIGITTNGTLIRKHVKTMKYLDYISVSIDSIQPVIGDKTRGKGVTSEVLRNINQLLRINENVAAEITLTRWNINDICNTVEGLINMGIKEVHINPVRNIPEISPRIDELKSLKEKLIVLKNKYPLNLAPPGYFDFLFSFFEKKRRPKLRCFSGSFFLKLDPTFRILCNYYDSECRKLYCKNCFCSRDIYNIYLSGLCSYNELPILTKSVIRGCSKGVY